MSYGLPGIKTTKVATPRKVLKTLDHSIKFPGGVTVNGALARDPLNTGDVDVLRAGMVMGKITATGLFAPAIYGKLLNNEPAGQTSIEVSVATATEILRRVGGVTGTLTIIGDGGTGAAPTVERVTMSNCVPATGIVTVGAITGPFLAGSVICPADGSEIPLGLIGDGYGHKVTDENNENINIPLYNLLVGGIVDESQIINWPTPYETQEWYRNQLGKIGVGLWIFDNLFTGTTVPEAPTPTPTPTPSPTPTPTPTATPTPTPT